VGEDVLESGALGGSGWAWVWVSARGRGKPSASVVGRDIEAIWDRNAWIDEGEGAVDLGFIVSVF